MKVSGVILPFLLFGMIPYAASARAHEAYKSTHSPFSTKLIYGKDDRKELFEIENPLYRKLADSTVVLFHNRVVTKGLGSFAKLRGSTLRDQENVCRDEPFAEQPAGGFCSGTLIAKNLVLTAGHCIKDQTACADTKFAFGYDILEKDVYPTRISKNDIFNCSSILMREQDELGRDYEVIELDRDVLNHDPVKIAGLENASPVVGASLVMIGHPVGLPTKIDDGGVVRELGNSNYFVATTDSYSGNSGSGVFNPQLGEMIGILTSGDEEDFLLNPARKCYESKKCALNDCTGEHVTRIDFLPGLIVTFSH